MENEATVDILERTIVMHAFMSDALRSFTTSQIEFNTDTLNGAYEFNSIIEQNLRLVNKRLLEDGERQG